MTHNSHLVALSYRNDNLIVFIISKINLYTAEGNPSKNNQTVRNCTVIVHSTVAYKLTKTIHLYTYIYLYIYYYYYSIAMNFTLNKIFVPVFFKPPLKIKSELISVISGQCGRYRTSDKEFH